MYRVTIKSIVRILEVVQLRVLEKKSFICNLNICHSPHPPHSHPHLFTFIPLHDRLLYIMGLGKWLTLLLFHPFEFRTLLQFYLYHEEKRDIKALKEHPTSGWDRESMRKCWDFLDMTSRSFSAVIKELDGDLARTVSVPVFSVTWSGVLVALLRLLGHTQKYKGSLFQKYWD